MDGRVVFSELITAFNAMGKEFGEDGVIFGICDGSTTGRPSGINRHQDGLPALQPSSRSDRLVYLRMGGSLLPVPGSSSPLGPLSPVIYAAHGPICASGPQLRISCARIPRRLPIRTFAARGNVDARPLLTSDNSNPSSFGPNRFKMSLDEGRVVRCKSCRASGRSKRHRADALLHRPAKGFEGPRSRKTPAERGATGRLVGFEESCVTFLRRMLVTDVRNAMCPLLHPCHPLVLGGRGMYEGATRSVTRVFDTCWSGRAWPGTNSQGVRWSQLLLLQRFTGTQQRLGGVVRSTQMT